MKYFRVVQGFVLILGCMIGTTAQAKIYIDITQVSDRSFPMAVVPLVRDGGDPDPQAKAALFSDVVEQDLKLVVGDAPERICAVSVRIYRLVVKAIFDLFDVKTCFDTACVCKGFARREALL